MSLNSIRRRVIKLVTEITPKRCYPPFTSAEIAATAEQVRAGEVFGTEELARLQQHSSIVDGEFIVRVCGSQVSVKQYVGVNLAEI
jgi:hypothetical protein